MKRTKMLLTDKEVELVRDFRATQRTAVLAKSPQAWENRPICTIPECGNKSAKSGGKICAYRKNAINAGRLGWRDISVL